MNRDKTIQIKVNEEEKQLIELYVSQKSLIDKKRYSVSTLLLTIVMNKIKEENICL
jgi:hypothetical protein